MHLDDHFCQWDHRPTPHMLSQLLSREYSRVSLLERSLGSFTSFLDSRGLEVRGLIRQPAFLNSSHPLNFLAMVFKDIEIPRGSFQLARNNEVISDMLYSRIPST